MSALFLPFFDDRSDDPNRAGRDRFSLNGSCCQLARHGVLRVLALLARKATVEIGWPYNGHCQAKALGRQNPTPLLNELLVSSAPGRMLRFDRTIPVG